METNEVINYITTLSAKCEMLKSELVSAQQKGVDATKFYAVTLTTEEVAKLHGVSPARVRDYASRGLIETHPNSTDAKLLFRASTVLTLDFSELKKLKLYQKR